MRHIGKKGCLRITCLPCDLKLGLDLTVFLDLCDIAVHIAEHDEKGMIDIPDLITDFRLDFRHFLQERPLPLVRRVGIGTHERGNLSHRDYGIGIHRIISQHNDRNDHDGHHHAEFHTECIVGIAAGHACSGYDLSGFGITFINALKL